MIRPMQARALAAALADTTTLPDTPVGSGKTHTGDTMLNKVNPTRAECRTCPFRREEHCYLANQGLGLSNEDTRPHRLLEAGECCSPQHPFPALKGGRPADCPLNTEIQVLY